MNIQLSDHFTYPKLARFVLPSIAMMIFTSIYSVVDGFFVSNFAGKTAFAAVNLVWPFVMICSAIGFMVGTGGSALVSMMLGMDERDKANRYFSMMVYVAIIGGAVISVVSIIFMRPIVLLLGADEAMLEDAVLYARILLAFNVPFMLQNVFQALFVTAEKPQLGLIFTVAAGLSNMVLDALLVGVIPGGVAGAAIATGGSEVVGGVIPLFYFVRKNSSLLRLVRTKLERRPILRACANGSSEMMSNVANSIVGMVYNLQLMKYVGQDGVATYGVLMYVSFVFVAVYLGYSIGSAPIVGYHYGAGNHGELKNMLRKSMLLMSVGGVALTAIALLLAEPISRIFVSYDAALLEMTTHAFRLYALAFLLSGVNIYVSSFFTALNNGLISALVSFIRVLVFQLLCVLVLPLFFGINGIWCALVVAEAMAIVLSLGFLRANAKRYQYM